MRRHLCWESGAFFETVPNRTLSNPNAPCNSASHLNGVRERESARERERERESESESERDRTIERARESARESETRPGRLAERSRPFEAEPKRTGRFKKPNTPPLRILIRGQRERENEKESETRRARIEGS